VAEAAPRRGGARAAGARRRPPRRAAADAALWREYLAPAWRYWPVQAAVAYALPGKTGDLYRFDGWRFERLTKDVDLIALQRSCGYTDEGDAFEKDRINAARDRASRDALVDYKNRLEHALADLDAGADRLAELVTALHEWLTKGGFLPEAWMSDTARAAKHGYTVTIDRSESVDRAVVVFVDGPDEDHRDADERPDGSPGCLHPPQRRARLRGHPARRRRRARPVRRLRPGVDRRGAHRRRDHGGPRPLAPPVPARAADEPARGGEVAPAQRQAPHLHLGAEEGQAAATIASERRVARGLPPLPKHTLRHTYISIALLVTDNVSWVMGQVGHADAETTNRVYRHLIPGARRARRGVRPDDRRRPALHARGRTGPGRGRPRPGVCALNVPWPRKRASTRHADRPDGKRNPAISGACRRARKDSNLRPFAPEARHDDAQEP
jgi:hypothetical protein